MFLNAIRFRPALATMLAAVIALLPGLASADSSHLSVDQARAAFLRAGYQVEPSTPWDWLSPPVSTFRVRDLQRERVLLVHVYGPADAVPRTPTVEGYSAATSIRNVTLFEAFETEYQRRMSAALERSLGMLPWADTEPSPSSVGDHSVDTDYLTVIATASDAPRTGP